MRFQNQQDKWLNTIGHFRKRRATETNGVTKMQGEPLLGSQGNQRSFHIAENDSLLELEQIYARQTGYTEQEKRRNYSEAITSQRVSANDGIFGESHISYN